MTKNRIQFKVMQIYNHLIPTRITIRCLIGRFIKGIFQNKQRKRIDQKKIIFNLSGLCQLIVEALKITFK